MKKVISCKSRLKLVLPKIIPIMIINKGQIINPVLVKVALKISGNCKCSNKSIIPTIIDKILILSENF